MDTRVCTKCLVEKPLDQFYYNPKHIRGDGRRKRCRECISADQREYMKDYTAPRAYYTPVIEDKRRLPKPPGVARAAWTAGLAPDDVPIVGTERHALGARVWRNSRVTLRWYEEHAADGCERCGASGPLVVDRDRSCCPVKPVCGNCARGVLCQGCSKA